MSDPYVEGLSEYMSAVRLHPRRSGEGVSSYIVRIAGVVAGCPVGPPVQPMPNRLDAIFSARQPGEEG